MYCVEIIVKTKPEYSVDGKYHETVNYYQGLTSCGGFAIENFTGDIDKALKFKNKFDAQKIAQRCDGEVKEI